MISPEDLKSALPLSEKESAKISTQRQTISKIISGREHRLVVITGPCSIHNPSEALEFARYLSEIQAQFPHLYLVMRVYFEKPRTTLGWKGLINDPHLDASYDIESGLTIARKLLLDITQLGLPIASEFLDVLTPGYYSDLISYGAIGARTTESQEHRKLASHLELPIGFKNATSGNIDIAIDAILSSRASHSFLSPGSNGYIEQIKSSGNPDGHIILRGGCDGTNYDVENIGKTQVALNAHEIGSRIIVDCSHQNSGKKHENQILVAQDIANQIQGGTRSIAGVMIEANLRSGAQKFTPGVDHPQNIIKGVSITDACISKETNTHLLEILHEAVKATYQ